MRPGKSCLEIRNLLNTYGGDRLQVGAGIETQLTSEGTLYSRLDDQGSLYRPCDWRFLQNISTYLRCDTCRLRAYHMEQSVSDIVHISSFLSYLLRSSSFFCSFPCSTSLQSELWILSVAQRAMKALYFSKIPCFAFQLSPSYSTLIIIAVALYDHSQVQKSFWNLMYFCLHL